MCSSDANLRRSENSRRRPCLPRSAAGRGPPEIAAARIFDQAILQSVLCGRTARRRGWRATRASRAGKGFSVCPRSQYERATMVPVKFTAGDPAMMPGRSRWGTAARTRVPRVRLASSRRNTILKGPHRSRSAHHFGGFHRDVQRAESEIEQLLPVHGEAGAGLQGAEMPRVGGGGDESRLESAGRLVTRTGASNDSPQSAVPNI